MDDEFCSAAFCTVIAQRQNIVMMLSLIPAFLLDPAIVHYFFAH